MHAFLHELIVEANLSTIGTMADREVRLQAGGRRLSRLFRLMVVFGELVPSVFVGDGPVGAVLAEGQRPCPSAPALAATFTLRPPPGQVGSATAVARIVTGGFQIKIDLKHLAKLGPGQFYECVYVSQNGGELVSAGTFSTSNGTVTMQSAANPKEFRIIQIRREQPGVDVQRAPVILTGVADTHP
jgi:hypothetical protein